MTITIIAPPQADAAAPAPGNRPGVAHIDPNMKLVTGTFCSASEDWFEEPLERGLRLILVQSGQLRCRIPGQPEHLIEGPSLCTIANDGDFTSAQIYGTDKPLRYTIVQLGVEALDSRLGWLPEQLIRRPGGDPRIMSCPAPRAMQALASQIATCQMLGPTRDLYLGGKALELAALSAQFLSGEGRPVEEPRITCSEVERIHEPAQADRRLPQGVRRQRIRLPAGVPPARGAPDALRRRGERLHGGLPGGLQPGAFLHRFPQALRHLPQRDPLSLRDDPRPGHGRGVAAAG